MSLESSAKKSDLIPLSVAVTLVSYSRDYIGRLAREGKIVAEQIDREWLVSRESLLNFAEHANLEDSAKKKFLSLSRKNDLEVKDFYTQKVSAITARQSTVAVASAALSFTIILGGFASGLVFYKNASLLAGVAPLSARDTLSALWVANESQTASLPRGTANQISLWSEGLVVESHEAIAMDGGIVLFSTVAQADEAVVENLFSDEVTVVITSTTTGFVRLADGTSELPFVRVPEDTETTF